MYVCFEHSNLLKVNELESYLIEVNQADFLTGCPVKKPHLSSQTHQAPRPLRSKTNHSVKNDRECLVRRATSKIHTHSSGLY